MRLNRMVLVLGLASLLTDLSSDMIYPLLPGFLASSLGAGALALGIIEGAAETTAAVLKIASGIWADRTQRRKPLVVLGYSISGLVRPLIGFALVWPVVLALRVVDRIGKGLRTSPRDALIADVVPPPQRGRAYGLHRAMDNAGALLGPLAATALLAAGFKMREVFWCAAIPAVLVLVVLVLGVREPERSDSAERSSSTRHGNLKDLGGGFHRLLLVVVLFTLGNSSDAFILLLLSKAGFSPAQVAATWGLHNLVRCVSVYAGGRLADRVDRVRFLGWGWVFYAGVYAGFAWARSPGALVSLLVLYGLHFGAVEATERALVAEFAPSNLRGVAFGWFHGAVGFSALPASAVFGALWTYAGPTAAFGLGAGLALVASALMMTVVSRGQSPASA
ncbi:MAG TPA: MFS transporter [Polyangiaceae bacterium]